MFHLRPDVGRIDLLGGLGEPQCLLPLALLAHEHHQEPVGTQVF